MNSRNEAYKLHDQNTRLRRSLARDLEIVLDEIQALHNSAYIFRHFRQLRNKNVKLLVPAPFIEWLVENYVHSTAVGIRRQLKRGDKRTVSFRGILERLIENPNVITRSTYKDMFRDPHFGKDFGNSSFDGIAGKGAVIMPTAAIESDLKQLMSRCASVEFLVDKRIAHYDRVKVLPVPTFANLEDAVSLLEELGRKYSVLLRGADRLFEFSHLEHWDNVLQFPWSISQIE